VHFALWSQFGTRQKGAFKEGGAFRRVSLYFGTPPPRVANGQWTGPIDQETVDWSIGLNGLH